MTDGTEPGAAERQGQIERFVHECTPHAAGQDVFEFAEPADGHMRAFGGLQMAQALAASAQTIRGFIPHSLHILFLRRVAPDAPVRFEVERVRDGRSFATRRVRTIQGGLIAGDTAVSFTRGEDGLSYDGTMPAVVMPEQADELDMEDAFLGHARRPSERQRWHQPVEQRVVHRSEPNSETMPALYVWMRPPAALPADPVISAAFLAYISDMATVSVPTRHHTLRPLRGTSLDHMLHLHHLPRIEDWLLFTRESPRAAAGRALVHGAIYTRDGVRLASCVQEVLTWEQGERRDPWERT